MTAPVRAVGVPWRTALALALASVAGLAMFCWPLLLTPAAGSSHGGDGPLLFVVILPALIGVVLAAMADGGIDTKAVAMLGVLSAVGAALRPVGAGVAGIETVFFLLVLAGRVFGPGFGFVLGNTTLFASALLTGGVGPWLPFQMLAAGWVGLGAGLLPGPGAGAVVADGRRGRGPYGARRGEVAVLAVYGAVSAYLYGFLLNLWFWPFAVGGDTQLSHVAGAPVVENLHRFLLYSLSTSAMGWDTGRAITNAVAIAVLGPGVLHVLRRAARRAAFAPPEALTP